MKYVEISGKFNKRHSQIIHIYKTRKLVKAKIQYMDTHKT